MTEVTCVWDAQATLGESPVWVAREQSLYWVDIQGFCLFQFNPETNGTRSWQFESRITSIAPRASGQFIATFANGFAELNLDSFTFQMVATPEPDRPQNRFNDAKVDPAGRFWAGTMDELESHPSGAIYRLDDQLDCRVMDDGYTVSNGPAFSPDGNRLYCADSKLGTVYRCDLDSEGRIVEKETFLQFSEDMGSPDGMTVDSKGCLWVCHWGGSRVTRFSMTGDAIKTIPLPVTNVSSCCFGGKELDILYITSARQGISPKSLSQQPLAGGLFACAPGVRGLPGPCFAG